VKEEGYSEDFDPVGDKMKADLRKVQYESVDWIYLALARDKWRAFVSTVVNFGI
jgi:hypothetical protein